MGRKTATNIKMTFPFDDGSLATGGSPLEDNMIVMNLTDDF